MKFLISFLQRFIIPEQSTRMLALACCTGIYIAFSPFIGLHTLMAIGICYYTGMHFPLVFAVSNIVNNPWTAIPLYMFDYATGYWLIHKVFHVAHMLPSLTWMNYITHFFEHTLSLPAPCIWSFLIGGNLVGIIASICCYPIMLKICASFISKPDNSLSVEIRSS